MSERSDHQLTTQPTGSPSPGEPVYLAVGRLRRTHGLKGEIVCEILTDFPERLRKGALVYLGDDRLPLSIRSRRNHQNHLLLAFDGYHTSEEAGALRNQIVYVLANDRPALPEGEYYHHQLLGLAVVTEDGRSLGRVVEILETGGASDVLVVRPDFGPQALIPVVEEFVPRIDLQAGVITVRPIPGLLPEDAAD
jgi:16S rRNA processing protein RimM